MANQETSPVPFKQARAELREAVGYKFWAGENLTTAEEYLLPAYDFDKRGQNPLAKVKVKVNLRHFPPGINSYEAAQLLDNVSTRSRFAMTGLEFYSFFEFQKNEWEAIKKGEERVIDISAINLSARPLQIAKGTEVFRLYTGHGAKLWREKKLVAKIKSGEIRIDGLSSENLVFDHDYKGVADGLKVPIDNWRWIPPSSEPILIDDKVKNYRDYIDSLSEPFQGETKPVLWIAETPKVSLSPGISATLETSLGSLDSIYGWALQIHSLVIDPGSDWKIRVEGFSRKLAQAATFQFWS